MSADITICRLCGGSTTRQFSRLVLNSYDVGFFKCAGCHSLQTQQPHWLDKAYTNSLAALDTGAAQRNLTNLGAVAMTATALRLQNLLDFGGGDGLLCRLLRDYGFNCFLSDKYAVGSYAQGFTVPDFERPDLVLAFEVFEHFANPTEDLAAVFALKPKVLLASTELFDGQDATWWYLTPETGQHVFFYSPEAVLLVAERHGYRVFRSGSYLVFIAKDRRVDLRERLLRVSLNRIAIRLLRTLLVAGPAPGRERDFENLRLKAP
jgi:Methyltransferase domain